MAKSRKKPSSRATSSAKAKATEDLETSSAGSAKDPVTKPSKKPAPGQDPVKPKGGEVIGKPHTPERARERWRAIRGRTGVLHSGHWLVDDRDEDDGGTGATFGATASCEVSFAEVSDEEIDAYVATGEPLGLAGGFAIDGMAGPFIERIAGDPHTVIGLSLPLLRRMLGEIGLGVHQLWAADGDGVPASPGDA